MTLRWRGPYKGGEIEIHAENLEALNSQVNALREHSGNPISTNVDQLNLELPKLEGSIGCADAVRIALSSSWGKREPRTMAEMNHIFETNAIFFSGGTLSGVLNHLTRTGHLRRLEKAGRWAYKMAS
jgi:hypothetical protein